MRSKKIYNLTNYVASVFMMLTLIWLTISVPFVNAAGKQKQAQSKTISTNPYGNTTEEKGPNTTNLSEEFLHELHPELELHSTEITYNKCNHPSLYIAFHGELLSPPPEAA